MKTTERIISISLKQAIEWYNSDNAALRELALRVYTEDELKIGLQYIYSQIASSPVPVPSKEVRKYNTLANLAMIAKYFNKDWEKTHDNFGYYISEYNVKEVSCAQDSTYGVYVYLTKIVIPGIVYFKELADAKEAIRIIGKRMKTLLYNK